MTRMMTLGAVAALCLASCQATAAPPPGERDSPPASAAPPAQDTSPARDTSPAQDAPARLTAGGWGPLRIGMTRAKVVAAAGEDAHPEAVGGPEPEVCDEFRPRRAPQGMIVMVERGRLTRISLGAGSRIRTDGGFGVGDAAAEIRAAYGARAEASPHQYQSAPAEYLTVWETAPPAPDARGLVYEVGADARVSRVHAGGPSIRYVEGCL